MEWMRNLILKDHIGAFACFSPFTKLSAYFILLLAIFQNMQLFFLNIYIYILEYLLGFPGLPLQLTFVPRFQSRVHLNLVCITSKTIFSSSPIFW